MNSYLRNWMPSRSKNKGNKFENDIVKAFNELHETEEFRRTPNSGAMMGQSNAAKFAGLSEGVRRTLSSDIITPDWFPFAIECKHYGDKPNYAALIKENDSTLDHWLGESIYDAINQNLHPMLCFKTDRKGVHIAVPKYWAEVTKVRPRFYTIYDSTFMIVGLDIWKVSGLTMLDAYIQSHDIGTTLEQKREEFFERAEVKKYIEQLEK